MDGEPTQPFGANVGVLFSECQALFVVSVVHDREIVEQMHVERLANGAEAIQENMVEAGEMIVLERSDDRIGECDRASDNGATAVDAALDQNLIEDVEIVFNKTITGLEMREDVRIANLFE